MKAPSVKVRRGVPDSEFPERTIEVCFPDGTGCLITFKVRRTGNYIDVWRSDDGIQVSCPAGAQSAEGSMSELARAARAYAATWRPD